MVHDEGTVCRNPLCSFSGRVHDDRNNASCGEYTDAAKNNTAATAHNKTFDEMFLGIRICDTGEQKTAHRT